jgi:hypothetical protein
MLRRARFGDCDRIHQPLEKRPRFTGFDSIIAQKEGIDLKLGLALWIRVICAVGIVPIIAQPGTIQGTIAGSTVIAQALKMHPKDRDDANIATTFDVAFVSLSPYIMDAAADFPDYHFVFCRTAARKLNVRSSRRFKCCAD